MKKMLEINEIHNGWILKTNENQNLISYHWDEEEKLVEMLLKLLQLKHKFAIVSRQEWAKRQESINV